MHEYHQEHNHLPTFAIFDKNGQPLLSWRVALLPYLGEKKLYDEFHLDETWDSPHNIALLPRMPRIFLHPRDNWFGEPGMTHYQVFVGKGSVFEGNTPLTLEQITKGDGTANTLMIAEAREPVPWTKPSDIVIGGDVFPRLGYSRDIVFAFAFGDGSVRSGFIPRDDLEKAARLLRQLMTWNGGEFEDVSLIVNW
jgi:hypothetical protein